LQTWDLGTGNPETGDPGTGDLRDLYKNGPLCPKEREEEKKERKKRKRRRRIWKRQDLCGRLEETRPAAEDPEYQCKVIPDGSGDF